jgi:uncharacterized membrane protein HdeD (DUF308 family)
MEFDTLTLSPTTLEGNLMSTTTFPFFLSGMTEELEYLRRNMAWFIALGAALIVVGLLTIGYPAVTTLTTVGVFGVFLLIAAGFEVASGVCTRRWGGFFLHLLCGLLYLFVGVVVIDRPNLAAAGYTLLLAMFFIASGLVRAISAVVHRFSGWGWVFVSGAVSLFLGVLIWREIPETAFWVIGTFLGIDLVFNGLSWLMLGLAARAIPASGAAVEAEVGQLARD